MRQNRNDEAADVLRRALTRREDPEVRELLAHLERELESSAGMAQRGSAHFHVTFQGDRDDALGEALVRVLEDKYRMLAGTFGHEPKNEIPVVLYPLETFRGVSGAPGWAGASYSHFDGRIRIGTRDLSAGFVPLDLERTLTHELVHAFVASLSRGQATRDINEGLAQYHSGARLGYRMARSRTRTVDGRTTVDDFYDGALSFVEYLLHRYRQSDDERPAGVDGQDGHRPGVSPRVRPALRGDARGVAAAAGVTSPARRAAARGAPAWPSSLREVPALSAGVSRR